MPVKRTVSLFFLILLALTGLQAQKNNENATYVKAIKKERHEKDLDLLKADNSPLDAASKKKFRGLNYFKTDPVWNIEARFERFSEPDTILMKTTTDRLPTYLVFGKASFTLNGSEYKLTVYRNVGLMKKAEYADYLFIPFRDETSGNESYGGGRYIDARIPDGNTIRIDFNRAYNPYCVYSKKYSCPVPPADNYLELRVEAGEKDYRH